jgi:signal transduction histidine kinase
MNNTFGVNLIPEKELKRIQSLKKYAILNNNAEPFLDHITKLATQIFQVSTALICFVGEEEIEIRSNMGLPGYKKIVRNASPCALTILQDRPTLLYNTSFDNIARTLYAGVPIRSADGAAIGTLCIMDQERSSFSDQELDSLEGLANLVMEHLEMRLLAAENELLQSEQKQSSLNEQRWKSMVMSAPMGMAVLQSRNLVIEIVNQPMLNFWNVDFNDVIHRPMAEVLPESFNKHLPERLADIFDTAMPLAMSEITLQVYTETGEGMIYADVTYDPLFDLEGNVDAIMVTLINITEIVEARKLLTRVNEEIEAKNRLFVKANDELADTQETLKIIIGELANSEARFRGVFERAPLGMALLTGSDKVIEFANDNMLKFWGKDSNVIGLPHRIGIPELEEQGLESIIDHVYQTGVTYRAHEKKAITIQNGVRTKGYYNFVYEPIIDEHGVTNILIIADDVTGEVRARKQANRTSEMLNMAVDSAELGTWFIDVESVDFIPSARLKSLFGFNPDEDMPYQDAINSIAPEYRDEVVGAITTALKNGESYDLEFPIQVGHTESARWLRATGNLYKPEPHKPSYYSGIVMDVTARKMDDQRKNDFIAMVSHELKTPLTSLKAYVQILISRAGNNQDDYTVQALGKAQQQINKMNNLIKGFLDVARLEAGKINLNIEVFDISELIRDVVADATEIMSSHELIFEPCGTALVQADKEKIGQVITNFLSNAVKYSGHGKQIFVTCSQNQGMVQVSVRDQGIGIKTQDIDKLFNRFYRIENTNTKTISGFGIGLYLCAEIIKRHNGRIWVESNPGAGSTFHFSLQSGV